MAGRHWEARVWVSSADWFKAGVARKLAGPTSLGIAPPRVYDSELLLLLLLPIIIIIPSHMRACFLSEESGLQLDRVSVKELLLLKRGQTASTS